MALWNRIKASNAIRASGVSEDPKERRPSMSLHCATQMRRKKRVPRQVVRAVFKRTVAVPGIVGISGLWLAVRRAATATSLLARTATSQAEMALALAAPTVVCMKVPRLLPFCRPYVAMRSLSRAKRVRGQAWRRHGARFLDAIRKRVFIPERSHAPRLERRAVAAMALSTSVRIATMEIRRMATDAIRAVC